MKPLFSFASWCAAHPRLSALVLGVVSATGFQPLGLWPLALAAMALLFALIARSEGPRRAALLGWLFGVGHFTLGNSWIATAFTYQAEMPAALGWAAVPLLSLYLAVYPALACAAARWIAYRRDGWPLAFAFAGSWIVSEWLRATAFSGYAWNPFGIVLLGPFDRPGLAAIAPWLGTYALSGATVFVAAALWLLLTKARWLPAALVAVLLVIGMFLPAGAAQEGTLRYTLVQPDIRQDVLNEPSQYENSFVKTAALTRRRELGERRLVLWPESGVSDFLQDGYPERYYGTTVYGSPEFARRRLGRVIGEGGMLLTGTMDLVIGTRDGIPGRAVGAHNTVTAVDAEGVIRGSYAKAHLVPYGEYLPVRELLEPLGVSRLVPGSIDFWPGPGPRTLDLGEWGKAGVQVCYEIVFSGQVADRANRPDYIFNPSNDGWFGAAGPPQHLAQARLRAIEEGLPILRSTTTGISAVIDARGVVRAHVPMHRSERLDGLIPPAAPPTLFARLGNILALAWTMIFIALAAIAMRRSQR